MPEQELWRVFCAIELPRDVRENVLVHSLRLRRAAPEVHASWSRHENLHLTLKFIGEIPQARVASLSKAAANACEGLETFRISVQESGVFPTHGTPRVLWLGIQDLNGTLGQLYRRLEEECAKVGFKKEVRPFHPHLTLARLRKPQQARTIASVHKAMGFEPAEITVPELVVVRSELNTEGSKYTTISRHRLGISAEPKLTN